MEIYFGNFFWEFIYGNFFGKSFSVTEQAASKYNIAAQD
jgi:hypothetical protein